MLLVRCWRKRESVYQTENFYQLLCIRHHRCAQVPTPPHYRATVSSDTYSLSKYCHVSAFGVSLAGNKMYNLCVLLLPVK